MHLNSKKSWLKAAIVALAAALAPHAGALSLSHYATQSRLAKGKWVKIAIPENGVYQLTADDLAKMGFSNPASVRVYGSGGHMMSEQLDGSQPDDLQPVPVMRHDGKICFYAAGPVSFKIVDPRSHNPRFTRRVNTYSRVGCYFLSDAGGSETAITAAEPAAKPGVAVRDTSIDYFYHENDLTSVGFSGKDLLGEDLQKPVEIPYSMPGVVKGSRLVVNTAAAANIDKSAGSIRTWVNGDSVPFSVSGSRIYSPGTNVYIYYNQASPVAAIPAPAADQGNVKVQIATSGVFKSAKLDYLMLTFCRRNSLDYGRNGQLRMGFCELADSNRIDIATAPTGLVVWNVDNPAAPVSYAVECDTLADGSSVASFTPGYEARMAQFVAFDPSQQLMTVDSWESVDNQNMHAMEVPDMLIITTKPVMEQARRIAKMHEDMDGMKVAVVDHRLIFNEFSSGTPDAMAYRMLCKMFYDRNRNKFKYLLLFGDGSYDNRSITSDRGELLLAYESDCSNDENYSYTCDDFFGMLDDNSGYNLSADMLRIAVGRIPTSDPLEAKADVDKLINYVTNPDYGYWRNNVLISADQPDNLMHVAQAEGVADIFSKTMDTGMNLDKVYVSQFPQVHIDQDRLGRCEMGTRRFKEVLAKGAYFATYIGHAGTTSLSKYAELWTNANVESTSYTHFPIMTFAACDVSRFDSDKQGIGELMFHKIDGGVIALLGSTRSVYAESNDALNTAFIKAMFNYKFSGSMPRLGDVYLKSKQSFGTTSNTNKLMFMLIGDPAMRVNYPQNRFKVTKINGYEVNDSTVSETRALQDFELVANVLKAGSQEVDNSFNGEATVALYDAQRINTTVTTTVNKQSVTRNIYYPRNLLSTKKCRVENGVIKTRLMLPRTVQAQYEFGMLRVYAHRDNSDEMVNGEYGKLNIRPYFSDLVIVDTIAPTVDAMCFTDEEAQAEGALVPAGSTLHITASDDRGINMQEMSIGSNMRLLIDGGRQTMPDVGSYATLDADGKSVQINYPIGSLDQGRHTATFTVYDLAGNSASKSISFAIGAPGSLSLDAGSDPAVTEAQFAVRHSFSSQPEVTVTVTDIVGNVVWSQKTAQFPLKWNLCDSEGHRVAPGQYKYHGTYTAGNYYGGTAIGRLVVINPLDVNK